jgi:hypothetical protein
VKHEQDRAVLPLELTTMTLPDDKINQYVISRSG